MRASLILLAGLMGGCIPVTDTHDFIEMHGSLADGKTFKSHLPATSATNPSFANLGTVTAVGAPISGPDDLRGFRIEWQPGAVTSGMTYASTADGPVAFFITGPTPDGGVDSDVVTLGAGSVTFTNVSTASESRVQGTVSNMTVMENGALFATITDGTFQATQP